jgi:hypothetical protein
MRKINPVAITAIKPSPAPLRQDGAPVQLVCLALILAVLMLGFRIVSIW